MQLTWEKLQLSSSFKATQIKLQQKGDSLFSLAMPPQNQLNTGLEIGIGQTLKKPHRKDIDSIFTTNTNLELASDPDFGIGLMGNVENVIGEDNRSLLKDTKSWPYCATGLIQIDFPKASGTGTGFLISPGIMVTAGHCVFLPKYGGWVKKIRFAPGFSGNLSSSSSIGYAEASRIWIPQQWKNGTNSEFDLAIVQLSETKFTKSVGYYGFGYFDDSQLSNIMVSIVGYPSDKQGLRQYGATETVDRISSRKIFYDVDTYASQSGSAVLSETSLPLNNFTAIAVHTFGSPTENSGTRFTKEIVEDIVELTQQN
jgi:glutamyl endopeptidase